MSYPTVFHLMSELSNKAGITCVLIGGFAINYYKVTRQTAEVDFLITKDDFDKIAEALTKAGFELESVRDVFARLTGNKHFLVDIDFMFVDKETLEKVIKDGKEISIARHTFIVPSLKTLIALKLHAIKHNRKLREYRDLPDIINLIRTNKVDVKKKEFHDLCLKYGTEELYKKVVEGVR